MFLFQGAARDPVLNDLTAFRRDKDTAAYFRVSRALLSFAVSRANCADVLREYALCALLDSPGAGDLMSRESLTERYLLHDAQVFFDQYFNFSWSEFCRECGLLPFPTGEDRARDESGPLLQELVACTSAGELARGVAGFFRRFHDRDEARYTAFRWENGGLRGVARAERMSFDQLAGIAHQKEALLQNGEAFMKGLPAHNVLLVGGSGTGKSSCVKATLTEFAPRGLRLVELPKQLVGQLPALLEVLAAKKCRYIIYIDDLSFEEVDVGYKELKVALDGRVEEKLPHVLIYVTSNRRHLIRETWKDREGGDEIHENDTLHEKRSLSERFGLHLNFSILSQREYFDVVELWLRQEGIALTDELRREASAWALTYNGRSGRTAKQFVDDYLGRLARAQG